MWVSTQHSALLQTAKNGAVPLQQSQRSLACSIPCLLEQLQDCMLDMQAAVCMILDSSSVLQDLELELHSGAIAECHTAHQM